MLKTLEEKDYELFPEVYTHLKESAILLKDAGVRCDIGHPHRFWEYGMGLNLLVEHSEKIKKSLSKMSVLDIGAGLSLFGPTLAQSFNTRVVEWEPEFSNYEHRAIANGFLAQYAKKTIEWHCGGIENIPEEEQFDAVFCISVVEHMPRHTEE